MRDHVFAAAPHVVAELPAAIDLVQPALPEPFGVWNQAALGSCGPHSACADIVFAALRQQKLSSVPMPSRLYVYFVTRLVMGTVQQDSGVDNRSLLKALNRYGWCDESLWPYTIGQFRAQPSAACSTQAAGRKIVQYLSVPQSLEQMRGCLAGGDPFIFGFTVYSSFESAAVESTGIVPMPKTSEQVLGGHDVLIVGYDDAAQRFKFRNSWGANWGEQGYGYFPYAFALSAKLASDFWTVRHAAIPDPLPPPPPPIGQRTVRVVDADGTAWSGVLARE